MSKHTHRRRWWQRTIRCVNGDVIFVEGGFGEPTLYIEVAMHRVRGDWAEATPAAVRRLRDACEKFLKECSDGV